LTRQYSPFVELKKESQLIFHATNVAVSTTGALGAGERVDKYKL